jgi:thiamine-phosphate diphosphorylase
MLQVRVNNMTPAELESVALDVRKATSRAKCLYIINDSLELAQRCGADGVHLGAEDMTVAEARRMAPELIIGGTSRTPEAAWQAEVDGADYVGCGSVYGSKTKPGLPVIGIDGLAAVNRYVSIPVTAIGGITLENCGEVMEAQVAGFCSIAPFLSEDPVRVVRMFTQLCRRDKIEP